MGGYSFKNRTKKRRSRVVGGVRESPNNEECPVCYEVFEEGKEPVKCKFCKYKYHDNCVRTWCARNPGLPCSCPNCRRNDAFSLRSMGRTPSPGRRRGTPSPGRRRGTPSPGRRRSPGRVTNDLIDIGDTRRRGRRGRTPPRVPYPPSRYLADMENLHM